MKSFFTSNAEAACNLWLSDISASILLLLFYVLLYNVQLGKKNSILVALVLKIWITQYICNHIDRNQTKQKSSSFLPSRHFGITNKVYETIIAKSFLCPCGIHRVFHYQHDLEIIFKTNINFYFKVCLCTTPRRTTSFSNTWCIKLNASIT